MNQQQLKANLLAKQKKRADYFKSYTDKRVARRVLDGNYGTWSQDHKSYYCDRWPEGLRDKGDAHKVHRRINHTGWYADNYQNALIIGRVLQLSAGRDGTERFIVGTYYDKCEGVTLHLGEGIFEDELEAASRADRCAEIEAEKEREDEAKFCAERVIEDSQEEIKTIRKDCLALLREMRPLRRGASSTPIICSTLRGHVAHALGEIKQARQRIAKLQENYWSAVE